jgi:aryl-alcohol dehydrogenase-like predicted oxidoreductase
VLAIASEASVSPTHVAIAWLLHKAASSTTSMIPILGPRTREQLEATLGAVDVRLTPEQLARLETVSAIELGVPHANIQENAGSVAGGKLELIDAPAVPVS